MAMGKGKKTAVFAVAAAILAGSLGTAAYAAQGSADAPKKNVLMWEEAAPPALGASDKAKDIAAITTGTAKPVTTEAEAYEAAENALGRILQVSLGGKIFDRQAEYLDARKIQEATEKKQQIIGKSVPLFRWETHLNRPIWEVGFVEQGEPAKDKVKIYMVTLDAANGDILKIQQLNPNPSQAAPATKEGFGARAAAFVENHGLTSGSVIRNVTSMDLGDTMQALIEMENGEVDLLGMDLATGQYMYFWRDLDAGFIHDITTPPADKTP